MPWTADAAFPSAALRIECSREGLARARSFTRETLRAWSLGHRCDDATLVMSELAANAATHAAPRSAGAPEVRIGFHLDPAHLLLTVSDPDDRPPVHTPASALEQHGRGLGIVDALCEAWGWTPTPPAGKTVWARLSAHATHPPT
ncbi:ATP-binding protein [Streptomyces sp. NPDC052012]|uniref:ATP-binding protein n=1 Tax=Streptomyces sp. NPDC052012 TaxID=3155051 RepID=UPI00344CA71E